MQAVPQLSNIRQVSDGWIKKYVLAYTMPDGSTYEYESASRKSLEAYRAELEGFFSRCDWLLLRMDRRRWMRPGVLAVSTLMRWGKSLKRRLTR